MSKPDVRDDQCGRVDVPQDPACERVVDKGCQGRPQVGELPSLATVASRPVQAAQGPIGGPGLRVVFHASVWSVQRTSTRGNTSLTLNFDPILRLAGTGDESRCVGGSREMGCAAKGLRSAQSYPGTAPLPQLLHTKLSLGSLKRRWLVAFPSVRYPPQSSRPRCRGPPARNGGTLRQPGIYWLSGSRDDERRAWRYERCSKPSQYLMHRN